MTAQQSMRGDVAVLVPAAGLGVRLGPGGPKALRPLRGEPLLVHAVRRAAAALAAVPDRYEIVLVHDAARALAPPELVERVAAAVRDGHAAVIPALPVVDTIKQIHSTGEVAATLDRVVLRAVQTPQGFRRSVLVEAHRAAVDEHTDDAGLVEKLGVAVWTVLGDEAALKITRPFDLALAELLLDLPPS